MAETTAAEWIQAAWEAARATGLLGFWQTWVAAVLLTLVLILGKIYGGRFLVYLKALKPAPVTDDHGVKPEDLSKPMDMPEGGMPLDQKPMKPEDFS